MMNMQGLMKQAQMMQKKMEEAQKKLAESEVTGSSGGGMVKVTLNGKFEAKKVGKRPKLPEGNFGQAEHCHTFQNLADADQGNE